jgi:hypothetical protein
MAGSKRHLKPLSTLLWTFRPSRWAVAEKQSNERNLERQRLVQVGARVEPELAAAVAQLADDGDRSVSREIRRALRYHVQHSSGGPPPTPAPEPERRVSGADSILEARRPAGDQ